MQHTLLLTMLLAAAYIGTCEPDTHVETHRVPFAGRHAAPAERVCPPVLQVHATEPHGRSHGPTAGTHWNCGQQHCVTGLEKARVQATINSTALDRTTGQLLQAYCSDSTAPESRVAALLCMPSGNVCTVCEAVCCVVQVLPSAIVCLCDHRSTGSKALGSHQPQ
jgi:hypothetical protein